MAQGLKENPNGFNAKYLLSFFEQNGNCGLHSELIQLPEFRFECKENLSFHVVQFIMWQVLFFLRCF